MNLKENMKIKRDEFWKDETERIEELISKEMQGYQTDENFASEVYKFKLMVELVQENSSEERIEIYAQIYDCEDNFKEFYVVYCIKDFAVVKYVQQIALVLMENGFEIIKFISEFSRKEMSKEKFILDAVIELD